MSNIDIQIIEFLEEKDLSIFELSSITGAEEGRIRGRITRLKNKGYLKPTEQLKQKPAGYRKYKTYTLVKYPDWFLAKRLTEDLEFLMIFFEGNKNVLLQNNRMFFSENIERFRKIAQRIEANGGNSDEE